MAAAEMLVHTGVALDKIDRALDAKLRLHVITEVQEAEKLHVSPVMDP